MTTWKHYKNLISKSAFDTFFPSFHGKTKQNANAGRIDNDAIVIVGRKGSGKTTILLFLIKLFLKFTKRDILVFTQVPENFESVSGNRVTIINVSDIVNESEDIGKEYIFPELSEIKDAMVVFDDIENIPVKNLNQQMTKFINLCFQNGRNYGLTIVLVLHHLNTGRERTLLIKEADSIVMFPGSMDNNLLKTLVNHYGFTKDRALDLFRMPEKFILLRNTEPSYIYGGSSNLIYPVIRF